MQGTWMRIINKYKAVKKKKKKKLATCIQIVFPFLLEVSHEAMMPYIYI
jgi:hypothetical protein